MGFEVVGGWRALVELLEPLSQHLRVIELLLDVGFEALFDLLGAHAVEDDGVGEVVHYGLDFVAVRLLE